MNRLCLSLVIALVTFFATNSVTYADLIVDVVGTPGSGETTWTFSGSYTVNVGATVGGNSTNSGVPTSWINAGNFITNFTGDPLFNAGGTTKLTGSSSGMLLIDRVSTLDLGADDQFQIASFSLPHTYVTGETLAFSGTSVLAKDLNDFVLGTHTSTTSGATLQLTFVPEPTSFAMFGIALVGMARRRRQR